MHFRYIILYTDVVVSTRLLRRPMAMYLNARRTGLSRELLTYVYVIIVVLINLVLTPRTRTRRTLHRHILVNYDIIIIIDVTYR